jgi:hypothetical protein
MAPRTLVRYEQIRRVEPTGTVPLDDAALLKGRTFLADCQPTDIVGNCVIVTGPAVLGMPQVTKVDIKTTGLTQASIGIIAEKSSATRCLVMSFGELAVLPALLIPGKHYWIGDDSNPTSVLPVPDPGQKIACQIIGSAIDTGRLLINPERRPTIRSG